MPSRPARTVQLVLGIVALLIGGTWVGQGLNLIPGSFMTRNRMWFGIGLVVVIVGVVLIVLALRRRPGSPRRSPPTP